jgi:hypothetical protein
MLARANQKSAEANASVVVFSAEDPEAMGYASRS